MLTKQEALTVALAELRLRANEKRIQYSNRLCQPNLTETEQEYYKALMHAYETTLAMINAQLT